MPLLGQMIEDARNVRQKSHVEHAIGLVEHDNLYLAKRGILALQVVEQATRRRDDDLDAGAKGLGLRIHVDAAIDDGAAQRRTRDVALNVVGDLVGQLARRRQHQCTHRMPRRGHAAVRAAAAAAG